MARILLAVALLIVGLNGCNGASYGGGSCNQTALYGVCFYPLGKAYGHTSIPTLIDPSKLDAVCRTIPTVTACATTLGPACSADPTYQGLIAVLKFICGNGKKSYIKYEHCLKASFFEFASNCPSSRVWAAKSHLTETQLCKVFSLAGDCAFYIGSALCGDRAAANLVKEGFLAYEWPGMAAICASSH